LGLSILVITLLSLASVLLGDVGLDEPSSALDPNTHVEDRPGTILYDDWSPYEVWEFHKRANDQCLTAESQLLSVDVDLDGEDELLFGTLNGSLIVLDVPSGHVLLQNGFEPGSGFGEYAYAHVLEMSSEDGWSTRLTWDTAGVGATAPDEVNNKPTRDGSPMGTLLAPLAFAFALMVMFACNAGRRKRR
jgi:hypothetical protein